MQLHKTPIYSSGQIFTGNHGTIILSNKEIMVNLWEIRTLRMINIASGESCITIYFNNMRNSLLLSSCVFSGVDAATVVAFCVFGDKHFGDSLLNYVDLPLVWG